MVNLQGPSAYNYTCTFKCTARAVTAVKVQALQVQIFTQVTGLPHSSGLKLDASSHVLDFCHCSVAVLLCCAVRGPAAVAAQGGRSQDTEQAAGQNPGHTQGLTLFLGELWPCEPPTHPPGNPHQHLPARTGFHPWPGRD